MRERVVLRYNRVWRITVELLAVLGVAAALMFIDVTTNLVAFVLAAFVGGSTYLSLGLARDQAAAELIHTVLRWAGLGGEAVCEIPIDAG